MGQHGVSELHDLHAEPADGGTRRTAPRIRAAALTLAPPVLVLVMSTSGIEKVHHVHGLWPLLAILGQSLPLLLLRSAPQQALVLVAGVTAAQLAAGLPITNGMLGQAVATAAVVARTRPPLAPVVPVVVLAASWGSASVGGQPGLLRFVSFTALSLLVAWVLGDAAGRRTQVRRAMEEELARRRDRSELRAQVVALEERLRIARELHDLVGEALDAVVLRVAAVRGRLGRAEAIRQLESIEGIARRALGEVDGFLGYLRRPVGEAAGTADERTSPVVVPEAGRFQSSLRLPSTAAVFGVGLLALVDALSVPPAVWPYPAWPAFSTAVVTLPLLMRRRAPEAVLGVLVTTLAALLVAGTPVGTGVLSIGLALHALASARGRGRTVAAATGTCGFSVAAAALVDPQEAGALAGPLIVLAAVAVYVGDTARVAREHNESLVRRLADAEEEGRLRERAAVMDERTRMARDLHDSIGHTLSLVILQAGAARLAAASPGDRCCRQVADALRSIETSARAALRELDAVVQSLGKEADGDGPDLPGPADLEDVVRGVRAAGTRVDVAAAPTGDLPRSLEVTILRIVQEALTNVVKHAPGARATVQVDKSDDVVSVIIHNDSGSQADRSVPSGGRGLVGMQERVAMFRGEFSAGPDGKGGHRVHARIPVPRSSPPSVSQTAGDHR